MTANTPPPQAYETQAITVLVLEYNIQYTLSEITILLERIEKLKLSLVVLKENRADYKPLSC